MPAIPARRNEELNMAFMNQERKAVIAAELKRVIPQGWKWTLGVRHHSTIVLNIWAAPADLLGMIRPNVAYPVDRHFDLYMPHRGGVLKGAPAEIGELFDHIAEALYRGNHDRSDLQTDYFDVGWYVDVNIGSYERPFVNTAAPVAEQAAA
jgi:hypothetical protein